MLHQNPTQRPSAVELLRFLAFTSEYPYLIPFRVHDPTSTQRAKTSEEGTQTHPLPVVAHDCSPLGASHRLLDLTLWRNQELEREIAELRQRLTVQEAGTSSGGTSNSPNGSS
ncbi:unnamed protein product [Echinostoma caproni]|uniref:RWD domain-containing protein n=1 Tax=Echinostoma caproni TaxID=27848 RepID=A0A183B5K4_9TREM|nr:unnamed protein product [Echinostoma caproni]